MSTSLTYFAYPTVLVACISTALMIYALKYQRVPGAKIFAGIMACFVVWAITFVCLMSLSDLSQKIFWARVAYLGEGLVSPLWVLFAFAYTGRDRWFRGWQKFLVFILPLVTIGLVWTNDLHHLIWTSTWLENDSLRVLHGSWFWVFTIYSYLCFFIGVFLLGSQMLHMPAQYRWKVISVIMGGAFVWVIHMVYVSETDFIAQVTLVPLGILCSSILFAIGTFRFHLLEINPIARDMIVEHMVDGLVVVDTENTVVDINPAACKILNLQSGEAIGRQVEEVIPMAHLIGDILGGKIANAAEIPIGKREFDFRVWTVANYGGEVNGRLVLLHDITDRKEAERIEREQQDFSEALRDSMAALNSTLCLEEVLDRVLTNVKRVVPHDAVNIMLLDGETVSMARHQGYSERTPAEREHRLEMRLMDVPNFRRMVETRQAVVISDTTQNGEWITISGSAWVKSYTGTPILARGEVIGFLNLNCATAGYYNQGHAERLKTFADQAAMAIVNANLYTEVQQMALTDSLTGLYNRRALEEMGKREVERALRFNRPLSALMLDVDDFKAINDTFGHLVGDEVLLKLVECIRNNVRDIDIMGRYGGDEFLLLLLENDIHTAVRVAGRVRSAFAEQCVKVRAGITRGTISVGVAEVNPQTVDFHTLVADADQALYRAKELGRNRVAVIGSAVQGEIDCEAIVS